MPWYVYIVECKDDSLYTGTTNNIRKRMKAHAEGKGSKYVRSKGFGRVLNAIKVTDKGEALTMEYQIKQLERNDKITFFMKHPELVF